RLARNLYGPRAAAVGTWLAACSVAVLFYSHQAVVDMQLTFWCTLCYVLFFQWLGRRQDRSARAWAYGLHATFAIAMMAKAPMAGIVVAAPLAVFAAFNLLA